MAIKLNALMPISNKDLKDNQSLYVELRKIFENF